ncbi:zinc finger Y-chromosomal protein 1-like [Dermacentor andersoni]|uniref:zinc finger Y-chromosomal protein 1-like n=1 Tax=Dermacentor andersoni TaxID=34620 RepID=UPI0024180641|nr:zinc finger protein 132-like [Dermacentor andersoni]
MCNDCGFMGYDEAVLAEHRRAMHEFRVVDPGAVYQCQICPSKFLHHDRLLCHLQRHTTTGSFDCFLCAKKFSREQHLVRHVMTLHSRVETFRCHLCPSKFSRKDNLVAHIQSHSNSYESWATTSAAESQGVGTVVSWEGGGPNASMCSDGGFTSHDEAVLAEHQQVDHQFGTSDPGSEYQCKFCPAKFLHHDRLLCHLQRHTSTGSFDCFLCEKKFSSEKVLVRHVMTLHSRVETFPCHLCPSKFSRKDNLVAHIRKHQADIAKH